MELLVGCKQPVQVRLSALPSLKIILPNIKSNLDFATLTMELYQIDLDD